MSEQQVWGIVDATGEVGKVVVTRDGAMWFARCGLRETFPRATPLDAVRALVSGFADDGLDTREILAPGEPTRAEAVAAARREGAEAMRAAAAEVCDDLYAGGGRLIARGSERILALPLPGDATPEHAPTPGPVCPAPTGAP